MAPVARLEVGSAAAAWWSGGLCDYVAPPGPGYAVPLTLGLRQYLLVVLLETDRKVVEFSMPAKLPARRYYLRTSTVARARRGHAEECAVHSGFRPGFSGCEVL